MTPLGVTNETHILSTNQLNPVISNINEKRKVRQAQIKTEPPFEMVSEHINWGLVADSKLKTDVDVATVMQACPKLAEMAHDMGGYLQNWNEFHRMAGKIRPMAGISEDAWNVSQNILGPNVAATVIALIFDKYSSGEVSSPGGYLRGIVKKAKAGELHLAKSLYGRLSDRRAIM
jgi:replication initiation protein RepC